MTSPLPSAHQALSLAALRRCDAACARFESALRAGQAPRIEEVVDRFEGLERAYLLGELIHAELELIEQRGSGTSNTLALSSYRNRFPDDSGVVDQVFQERRIAASTSASDPGPTTLCLDDSDALQGLGPGHPVGSYGSSAEATSDLPARDRIGPYRIVSFLASGGMGVVYRAMDERLGRSVAIKVLPPVAASDGARRARFEREVRAVAAVSHPNILTIYDYGLHKGMPYAVTELLDGPTLRERLRAGALKTVEVIRLGLDLASGLASAHQRGVVHRDLKPENIIGLPDGSWKILDFGLARLERPASLRETEPELPSFQTDLGTVMGTVGYMAPEQVRGETVDRRCDLFALGCVLFEALGGQPAFARPTVAESMASVLSEEPAPTPTERSHAARGLVRIIRRCLAKDPGDRFGSAVEVVETLRALEGRDRRAWAMVLASTLMGLALVLVLGWAVVTGLRRGDRFDAEPVPMVVSSLAILPFENRGDREEVRFLANGLPISLSNRLARVHELEVRPFDAVPEDRDGRSAAEIGRDLRVDHVLTGSIDQLGGKVVVRFQLVEVDTNRVVTGDECTGLAAELSRIQAEVTGHVAEQLQLRLDDVERLELTDRAPVNLEAFKQYIRGREAWKRRDQPSLDVALEAYRRAIELDPDYAEARARLAACLIVRAEYGLDPARAAYDEARSQAEQALKRDSRSAYAYVALGMVRFEYDWDYDEAERAFLHAIQLQPHLPIARQWYAELLSALGRHDEAIFQAREAAELDLTSPIRPAIVGRVLYKARRFDEAVGTLQAVLAEFPDFSRAHAYLAEVYEQRGQFDLAIQHYGKFMNSIYAVRLQNALDQGGATGYWQERLDILWESSQGDPISPTPTIKDAMVLARLNRVDEAIRTLERAAEARDGALTANILVSPAFDSLRKDPRFQYLLRVMNFK